MKTLQRNLGKLFGARRPSPAARSSSVTPKLRDAATNARCSVETLPGGGFNVWPPADLEPSRDPYDGDHYAYNAKEAHEMVRAYAALSSAKEQSNG